MIIFCTIFLFLFFEHSLVCEDQKTSQSTAQNKNNSFQSENAKDHKPSKKSEDVDLDYKPSFKSADSSPDLVFVIGKPTTEQLSFENKLRLNMPLNTSSNEDGYTFYQQRKSGKGLAHPKAREKVEQVYLETEKIIEILKKGTNTRAETVDLLAINDLYFRTSEALNTELQKTKYNIQRILYDNHTGEFKGIKNYDDTEKIQNEIDKFKIKVEKWASDATKVHDSFNDCDSSIKPYSEEWDKKVKGNKFNQDLNRLIELCKSTSNLIEFKTNLDKAKKIIGWHSGFEPSHPLHRRHVIANKIHIIGSSKYKQQLRLQQQQSKISQQDKSTTNSKELLVNKEPLETFVVNNLATNAQAIEDIQLQKYISCSSYKTRFESWQESLEKNEFATKSYELTPESISLLRELDIDGKPFVHCYGNPFQQALHAEFVSLVNNAGLMYSHSSQQQARELAREIATFSDIGSSYLKAGFVLKATYTANFCWALLDCCVAMGEKIVDATLHPIETIHTLVEAISNAGHSLSELLGSLGLDQKDIIEKYFPNLDPKNKEAMLAFAERLAQDANEKVRNIVIFEIEAALTGKLLTVIGKFFNTATSKTFEIAKKIAKGGEEAAVVLTTELPVQIKIAEKTTKHLLEKVRNSGTAKPLETLQRGFKVVIDGVEEILPEVARLNSNDVHHILNPKHAWEKLVKDPKDWNSVSRIISKVLREGVEGPHKGISLKKTLEVVDKTIEVTFVRLQEGIKISNAWVK